MILFRSHTAIVAGAPQLVLDLSGKFSRESCSRNVDATL